MENKQSTRQEISDHEIEQKVIAAVSESLDLDPAEVLLTSSLENDFGAESLDYLDIAYMLEREFNIQFPREDLLQRAADYFGEEALLTKSGLITDLGLELLRKGMPELDTGLLKPGLKAVDLRPLFTVQTFVRVVQRLLEAKQKFPRECPDCGTEVIEADVLPQFECPKCSKILPFPTGDTVIFQDLVSLAEDTKNTGKEKK